MRKEIDRYQAHFKQIVEHCMVKAGCNPRSCFECGVRLNNKTRQIHHLKYEGATIRDLRFGCHECNMKPKYRGLV